jgi:hypothetical protein
MTNTDADATTWCACPGPPCEHEREEGTRRCLNVATTTRYEVRQGETPYCRECARTRDQRLRPMVPR